MYINSVNKALVNGLGNKLADQKVKTEKKESASTGSESVRVRAENIISQAIKMEDIDPASVAKARKLISAGKLDTTDNIETAVKRILKFGF